MQKTAAILAVAAVGALIGGSLLALSVFRPDNKFASCGQGAVGGSIGGPFTLVDETGATVTDAEVITDPTLIYFGYTFCPDVCPLDNMRNAQAVEILEERGVVVTPVFISIDPERDTVERVADFTDFFHDRMIGLTGSPEQVRAASQAYRTYYQKQDSEDEFYLVDHSVQTYFVTPKDGFVDFFNRDETPEAMADRVQCLLEAVG